MTAREIMETTVGPLGRTLAGKHASRIFLFAAIRIHAAGVWKGTGQIFRAEEVQDLAPVPETGNGQLGNRLTRQALRVVLTHDYTVTYLVGILRSGRRGGTRRPRLQLTNTFGTDVIESLVVGFAQLSSCHIRRALSQRDFRIPIEWPRQGRIVQGLQGFIEAEGAPRSLGTLFQLLARSTAVLRDLREIPRPLRRDQGLACCDLRWTDIRDLPGACTNLFALQRPAHGDKQPVHAGIVEAARDG